MHDRSADPRVLAEPSQRSDNRTIRPSALWEGGDMSRSRATPLLATCVGWFLLAVPGGRAAEDRFGDTLPPAASARLGTARWRSPLRDGSGYARVCFSPNSKVVACV